MPKRLPLLKSLFLASTIAVTGAAASAENVEVYVYEKGYLPNFLYLGNATEVTFVNKDSVTMTLNYGAGAETLETVVDEDGTEISVARTPLVNTLVQSIRPGGRVTVARAQLDGRNLKTPYVDGVGYIGLDGTFQARSGFPPLQ